MVLSLPLLVAAGTLDTEPPVPTGYDLLVLTHDQFQLCVAGICEGQVLMASMVQAEPVVCIGSMLMRMDVAALCLAALRVIPDRMMTLPAAEVVMSILMKQHPRDEAGTRRPRKVSPPPLTCQRASSSGVRQQYPEVCGASA